MAQRMLRTGRRDDIERDPTFGHEHAPSLVRCHILVPTGLNLESCQIAL